MAATTRDPARAAMLRENGAAEVFLDDGAVATSVRARRPEFFDTRPTADVGGKRNGR